MAEIKSSPYQLHSETVRREFLEDGNSLVAFLTISGIDKVMYKTAVEILRDLFK